MLVRAPGSTANLGPGFDCLGLALDLPFWFAVCEVGEAPPSVPPATSAGSTSVPAGMATAVDAPGMLPVEKTHPAAVAFFEAGGDGGAALWWRSPIPPGRGLGFSGAARVAGAFAARRLAGDEPDRARPDAFEVAGQLEGHGDNAAASTYGGFVVVAGGTAVPVAVPRGLSVLTWSPASATSTDASRAALPQTVTLGDAAFSIARSALWVAALSTGRTELLREASRDRVHQPTRLLARPDAAEAMEAMLGSPGVLAAWLSGSGPTVAALVDASLVPDVTSIDIPRALRGSVRLLEIGHRGVIET